MTARTYPSRISGKGAKTALTLLLTGCTDARLASFTARELAAAYRVPETAVEEMLASARQGRSG